MRSNSCRSSTKSNYMLSVMDFDPMETISEIRVHAGAIFGPTEVRSIAKCRFPMNFWKSFDHHGKAKKEMVKKEFRKWTTWKSPEICEKNWWVRYRLCMREWPSESCKREVGKDSMIECSPGPRSQASPYKSTLCVLIYCAGRVMSNNCLWRHSACGLMGQ